MAGRGSPLGLINETLCQRSCTSSKACVFVCVYVCVCVGSKNFQSVKRASHGGKRTLEHGVSRAGGSRLTRCGRPAAGLTRGEDSIAPWTQRLTSSHLTMREFHSVTLMQWMHRAAALGRAIFTSGRISRIFDSYWPAPRHVAALRAHRSPLPGQQRRLPRARAGVLRPRLASCTLKPH